MTPRRQTLPARRRFRRRPRAVVWLLIALALVVAAQRMWRLVAPPAGPPQLEVLQEGTYRLARVVDGDTIIVAPREEPPDSSATPQARVRLLGIDAPETVKPNHPVEPWGPEADVFVREFLKEGELEIRLDRRRKDRFGRCLAYAYVDGEMLNEALVRAGLARVYVFPGDSPTIARRLRAAEDEARQARRGLWRADN